MRAQIDRDAVRIRRKQIFANFLQAAVMFVENCDDAAFGRHVETLKSRIKGKNVRIRSNGKKRRCLLRLQIENNELRIVLTSRKREAMFRVKQPATHRS